MSLTNGATVAVGTHLHLPEVSSVTEVCAHLCALWADAGVGPVDLHGMATAAAHSSTQQMRAQPLRLQN